MRRRVSLRNYKFHPAVINDILHSHDGINATLARLDYELITRHKTCRWRKHMRKTLDTLANELYAKLETA